MDIERLKRDRDYWDSKDPTGGKATHYGPESDDWAGHWYVDSPDGRNRWTGSAWKFVGKSRQNLIPRPTRKQWSGPEDGLPPVGSKVQGYVIYGASGRWREAEILKHGNSEAAVYCENGGAGFLAWCREFRSIRTEKERVMQWALSQDCEPHEGMLSRTDFCAKLYDLGALKMPEEP